MAQIGIYNSSNSVEIVSHLKAAPGQRVKEKDAIFPQTEKKEKSLFLRKSSKEKKKKQRSPEWVYEKRVDQFTQWRRSNEPSLARQWYWWVILLAGSIRNGPRDARGQQWNALNHLLFLTSFLPFIFCFGNDSKVSKAQTVDDGTRQSKKIC